MSRSPLTARGFSLIEVMITVFIVAVGLLSVAGLQALSKKSNFDSIQRTTAAALAQDIIERMRANPGQGAAYLTDATAGISAALPPAAPGVACSKSTGGSSPACTPAQVVAFDRYEWSRALFGAAEIADNGNVGGLSEATGCIVNATPPCGVYTVVIAWRGITPLPAASSQDSGNPANQPCGNGNAAYDDPGTSAVDSNLRRVIVVQTVIDDHSGLCAAATP